LSIDWGYGAPKPLLTPYELFALLENNNISEGYSMDYYSHNGGPWANFYGKAPIKKKK
jgi:diphthamide synthase subunit DPH2